MTAGPVSAQAPKAIDSAAPFPSRGARAIAKSLNDALESNYSAVGAALIERLYAENFLSLSGADGTDRLVADSGVAKGARVLDIGCGVGGPAMRLAARHGLIVTGLDLVASNVETARARAAAAGLGSRVEIRQGDATALPFADDSFDAVFSQDAICHMPDKPAVFAEAARVARPGAAIALTDWVRTGAMDETTRAAIHDTLPTPGLETRDGYAALLEEHGFTVTANEDISEVFAATYEQVIARLAAMEAEVSQQYSPRVFAIMLEKNGVIQSAFEAGTLGGCLIVGRRG